MPKVKLTILLIKSEITDFNQLIRSGDDIHSQQIGSGVLYYKLSQPHSPKWVDTFFDNSLNEDVFLQVSSVNALYLIRRRFENGDRIFAISFGFGRFLLNPDVLDIRFGLITTLNSIKDSQIRSVDLNTLESIPRVERVQTSKLSEVRDFGIDEEHDLLRSITGKTKDNLVNHLGNSITGSESLRISVDATFETVGDVLDICYRQYLRNDYLEKFDWINNLHIVKDNNLIHDLNERIVRDLNFGERDTLWMSIPDVLDYSQLCAFRIAEGHDVQDDINIDDVIQEVYEGRTDLTLRDLTSRKVYAVNGDNAYIGSWSYYKCIYGEVTVEAGRKFILNEGQWYEVDCDYLQEVEDYYANAMLSTLDMPNSLNGEHEGDYNQRLANLSSNYILMDKKLIPTGVSRNNIEVCDVYTVDKNLIHVKNGHGSSSVLSHLFNQGYVAAILLAQRDFRLAFNHVLNQHYSDKPNIASFSLPTDEGYNPSDFTITYAIITKKTGDRPSIPFFSKITFRNIAKTLTNMGYNVLLKNIE